MHPDENMKEDRVPQVQYQLVSLKEALERLHDYIGGLRTKLHPILVSVPPAADGKPETPGDLPELVPLADNLRDIEERVDTEANRIRAIMERCEL